MCLWWKFIAAINGRKYECFNPSGYSFTPSISVLKSFIEAAKRRKPPEPAVISVWAGRPILHSPLRPPTVGGVTYITHYRNIISKIKTRNRNLKPPAIVSSPIHQHPEEILPINRPLSEHHFDHNQDILLPAVTLEFPTIFSQTGQCFFSSAATK